MYRNSVKRGLSVACCLLGLTLFWWVYVILAVAIVIDDPGPVFFRQKRVAMNRNGETQYFEILKFRSMKMCTPHDTPTHLLKNPEQYITRVGAFLRKYSLDELPQVFNVLKGDMAFVGPRPALWNQFDLIEARERVHANDVRPGITGWAQIHGRDELEIDEKAALDGYYVAHLSLWMDLKCLFGTVLPVLRGSGVVEGGTGAMKMETVDQTDATDQGRMEESAAAEEITVPAEPRKKILFLTNHSYMFWQFRRELALRLQENYDVAISTPFVGHQDDFAALGFRMIETPIDRRGINPVTDLKLIRHYRQILRSEQPDMVITYSIKPNIYGGLLCGLMGIPYSANVQGLGTAFQKRGLTQLVTVLYKLAFRKVNTVFFENTANAEEFVKRGILPAEKETILPGAGINLEHYAVIPYPRNEKVHFLYLGRIMKEKGMDELFASVRKLAQHTEGFVLDLVGFYEDEYESQVKELEEQGIVVFHGFREDPRPFYGAADAVVLPSYHEGMSNVLLEAAATGRPLITSDIPGCREAVEDSATGMLVQVKSARSLCMAMARMMKLTREQREAMGMGGREKMAREFEKKTVVEMTVESLGL